MRNDDIVSIIMPYYKRKDTIDRAIGSVINQTHVEWELIIIDDASEDGIDDYIIKYNDARIKCVTLGKNSGACHARNIGIHSASGNYLAFLDSDNEWNPFYLERRLNCLVDERVDFVFGYYNLINLKGEKSRWPEYELNNMNDKEFVCENIFLSNLIDTNTIVMKKSLIEKIGYFDESLKRFQDWDYFGRLFLCDELTYVFQNDELVYGYEQENSISNTVSFWPSRIELLKKHADLIRKRRMMPKVIWKAHFLFDKYQINDEQKEELFSFISIDDIMQIMSEIEFLKGRTKWLSDELLKAAKVKKWSYDENKIGSGKKVVVYGYGDVGRDYVSQSKCSKNVSLIGVIDRNVVSQNKIDGVNFFPIEDINKLEYDYIIVAIYKKETFEIVRANLIDIGVDKDKILWFDFSEDKEL